MPEPVSMNHATDSWENEGGGLVAPANDEVRGIVGSGEAVAGPVGLSPRSSLVDALERVLNGAGAELAGFGRTIAQPDSLTRHESEAWEQLRHWTDEADLRARDRNYTAFHLEWLRDLHSKLAQ